jgi:1,4-dihydroxy-2-naphthoate octaprenyltransferase
MATTALNNYIDTRASGSELPFSRPTARVVLLVLLTLATAGGIWLAVLTSPVVLLAGAACFFIGIVYTFGPAPISRMPLGEVFSGLFMGFFIPFIVAVINLPGDALVGLGWHAPQLVLALNIPGLLHLMLLAIPPICGIANIMLANNICDVEHDVQINRFTLPFYLGKTWSLRLFAALAMIGFVAIALIGLLGILPVSVLLALPFLYPVLKNIRLFNARQSKPETFPLSVQNFILTVLPMIVITVLDRLVRLFI